MAVFVNYERYGDIIGLDDLISICEAVHFEKPYLLESEKKQIIGFLSEKSHILEYDNTDFNSNISDIVREILFVRQKKYVFNSYMLSGIEWLDKLEIIADFIDGSNRPTGKALKSESVFDYSERVIRLGKIKILIYKNNCRFSGIESVIKHELKHLFTALVEYPMLDKEVIFRNKYISNKNDFYQPFILNTPSKWHLNSIAKYEYNQIKNTIIEFGYYVNRDEMRSKLENVCVLFKEYLYNTKISQYVNAYRNNKKTQFILDILKRVDVIETYKKVILFCKAVKHEPKIIKYIDDTILWEACIAYGKHWSSSNEWIDCIIERLNAFFKKVHQTIAMIDGEVYNKVTTNIKTKGFFNQYKYIKDLMFQDNR